MQKRKRTHKKTSHPLSGFLAGTALGLFAVSALAAGADRVFHPEPPAPSAEPIAAVPAPPVPEPSNPEQPRTTTIAAVGDLVFSRKIADRLPISGWKELFAGAKPLLAGRDIVFGNLETPVSYRGTPYPGKFPDITFRAPPGILLGIREAGFTVLSIANNHISDYGAEALGDTIAALDAAGIARCGAGRDGEDARRPAVLEANGKRFAFLAYVEPMWSAVRADNSPGAAWIDAEEIEADIGRAKGSADFVLLSLHWGEEHAGVPRYADRALARRLVDAGADAIIGHHPHVLQGAEFYRGKPILYSLGNFVFDMRSPKTYETAEATLVFGPEGPREVRFTPARIDAETFGPAAAEGDDARNIGALLASRCAALGSTLEPVDGGTYRLRPPGAYRTPESRNESSSSVYGLGIVPSKP